MSAGFISVSVGPGRTLLIVIPRAPNPELIPSPAHAARSCSSHSGSALKGHAIGVAAADVYDSHPPSFMCWTAACVATNTARTFTAKVKSRERQVVDRAEDQHASVVD